MSWQLAQQTLTSRLLLGSAQYPSLQEVEQAVQRSGTQVVTVALRRQTAGALQQEGQSFWQWLRRLSCHLLPNTAGCFNARDAITTAQMAREIFKTNWIKVEVIYDDYSLCPDPIPLIAAVRELIAQGFEVFPYCSDDVSVCGRLIELGCRILMPGAAPIGSGQGIINPKALRRLRDYFPEVTLIVDAGIGAPSHAAYAMELGADAVLINSAVAYATKPADMAVAFSQAVQAGHQAYNAGLMPQRDFAVPSTPLLGRPFWQEIQA